MVASSGGTVIAVVIALWLLCGAACGLYLFVRRLLEHGLSFGVTEEEKERRRELRAYNKEVRSIEAAHETVLRQARAELRRVEKGHSKRVANLEKQLEKAKKPAKLDGIWSSKSWAKLFEDRLETSKGNYRLMPDLVAEVSSSGSLAIGGRSTLTRMGTGAIVAGPLGFMVGMAAKKDKKVDARELYLIVQNEAGGVVLPCSPDKGEKVRQLALNIHSAARRAPEAARQRAQLVRQAEAVLAAARADTGDIDERRKAYQSVEEERPQLPPAPAAQPALAAGNGEQTP